MGEYETFGKSYVMNDKRYVHSICSQVYMFTVTGRVKTTT